MSGKASSSTGTATKTKKPSVSLSTNAMAKAGPSSSPSSAAKRLPGAARPQSVSIDTNATANGVARATRRLPRVQTRTSMSELPTIEKPPAFTPTPYVVTEEWILKTFKGCPPSLVVHLHPTYFRFDQQQGSFSYQSEMKVFIEHLRAGTIPHDMIEELRMSNVRYYHDWLIVKIFNHKNTAAVAAQTSGAADDEKPFSINNYNHFITPSPYAPYPKKEQTVKMERSTSTDKENLAPEAIVPQDQRSAKAAPKVFFRALRPTELSRHTDLTLDFIAIDPKSKRLAKPPTPVATVPPTPSTERPPPPKRQKLMIDPKDHLEYEARIINGTAAPLYLEPAQDFEHAERIHEMLTDPFYQQDPPSPKSRKRTHAELAADESHAKEQERFMLIMDSKPSASGGNNVGLEQANAYQPRFEHFIALDKIKGDIEDKKRQEAEKRVAEDEQRRSQQQQQQDEDNRRKAQQQAIEQRKEQAIMQSRAKQMQVQRQQAESMAQQSQQNVQGGQRRPHLAQPQPNGIPPNMQSQMMGGQGSPIIRQGTPNAASSPAAPVARTMARSGSQTGGAASPPRPGSSLQHAHPNAANMMRQTSGGQGGPSRNGTPQIPHSTPGMPNATPIMRQGTPGQHMTQQSPMGNIATPQMAQVNMQGQMVNGMQQPALTQQQMAMLQARRAQQIQQMQAGQIPASMTPQMVQQFNMQQQQQAALRQQQAQQQAQGTPQQQHMSPAPQPQHAAYTAQLKNMMRQQMPGGQGSPAPQGQMSPQQQQQMQQQQVNIRAQQQAAMMQGQQVAQQGADPRSVERANIVNNNALIIFKQLMVAESQKYGGNPNMIPPPVKQNLQAEAQKRSMLQYQQLVRQRQMAAQSGMMSGNMNAQNPQMAQQMQQMQLNRNMVMMQQQQQQQQQQGSPQIQQVQQQQMAMQNAEALVRHQQQQQQHQQQQDYMTRLLQQQQMQGRQG